MRPSASRTNSQWAMTNRIPWEEVDEESELELELEEDELEVFVDVDVFEF